MSVRLFGVGVEVEDRGVGGVVFLVSGPVFPAGVPSFCRRLVRSVFHDGVGVLLRVSYVDEVVAVEFCFPVVHFSGLRKQGVVDVTP